MSRPWLRHSTMPNLALSLFSARVVKRVVGKRLVISLYTSRDACPKEGGRKRRGEEGVG